MSQRWSSVSAATSCERRVGLCVGCCSSEVMLAGHVASVAPAGSSLACTVKGSILSHACDDRMLLKSLLTSWAATCVPR
jgi:hypothetical protein